MVEFVAFVVALILGSIGVAASKLRLGAGPARDDPWELAALALGLTAPGPERLVGRINGYSVDVGVVTDEGGRRLRIRVVGVPGALDLGGPLVTLRSGGPTGDPLFDEEIDARMSGADLGWLDAGVRRAALACTGWGTLDVRGGIIRLERAAPIASHAELTLGVAAASSLANAVSPENDAVVRLVAMVRGDPVPAVRGRMLGVLGMCAADAARPLAREVLVDGAPEERLVAAGLLGDEDAIAAIASDPSAGSVVRADAFGALGAKTRSLIVVEGLAPEDWAGLAAAAAGSAASAEVRARLAARCSEIAASFDATLHGEAALAITAAAESSGDAALADATAAFLACGDRVLIAYVARALAAAGTVRSIGALRAAEADARTSAGNRRGIRTAIAAIAARCDVPVGALALSVGEEGALALSVEPQIEPEPDEG